MRALVALGIALIAAATVSAETTYHATSSCAWDQATLDVAIVTPVAPVGVHHDGESVTVPPALVPSTDTSAPWDAAHARAAADAIDSWETALHTLAQEPGYGHLASLDLRWTMVGPEMDASILQGADIVVAFVPVLPMGGVTAYSCASLWREPVTTDGPIRVDPGTGVWIAMNQWFVFHFTPTDTYNVMLHEFGHALGLDHIASPAGDTMNPAYAHTVGNVHNPQECLSNLDVLQAAVGWRWLDGVTPYTNDPPGTTLTESAYRRAC